MGSGAKIVFKDSKAKLTLDFEKDSSATIDEVFSGSGQLIVEGTAGQSFGFESSGSSGYSGKLTLNTIGMTVGGASDSIGLNNAGSLSKADVELASGAVVTVSGASVNTFNNVTVLSGGGGFEIGGMGFGTGVTGTSVLSINGTFEASGATTINVTTPSQDQKDVAGSIAQSALLSNGQTPFQTLIATGNAISASTLDQLKLSTPQSGFGQVTQNISGAAGNVATGYYDYALALGDSGTDLGILYTLTQVDIHSGQTLTLSESGSLTAQITSSGGAGNLEITQSGIVTLGKTGEVSSNSYSGNTTVLGQLTAYEKALGNTQHLNVSGTYVNAGSNAVDYLSVAETGSLVLNANLTLSHVSTSTGSAVSGALSGAGNLLVSQGTLTLNENGASAYAGTIELGSDSKSANLVLNGAEALASGSVTFANSASSIKINDSGSVAFANALSGLGSLSVNLSGGDFSFANAEDDLSSGSNLILDNTKFDLSASEKNSNDDVGKKLVITVNSGSALINSGTENKQIAGLKLTDGAKLDLGELNTELGQISLNKGGLEISGQTTVTLSSQAQTSSSGDRVIETGSELLAGGLFDLTIFNDVGSVNSGALGTADESGNQKVSGLIVDTNFSGTTEHLLQDVSDDVQNAWVADMTRDSGAFFYNSGTGAGDGELFLQYTFKQIDLLWKTSGQGLTIDATNKNDAKLSAQVTGEGNLLLGGILTIGGSTGNNSYTGSTYVLNGASVMVAQDSGLGLTQQLDIQDSGAVTLGSGLSQTVGSLTGSGALVLESGAQFTIENQKAQNSESASITISNSISGASGAQFVIDGSYGTDGSGNATVAFKKTANLSGSTFTLQNSRFEIAGSGSNYETANSSSDFVIGDDASVSVDAAGNPSGYEFKELSFSGGTLSVTGVTLTNEGQGTSSVIHVGTLDLEGSGSLSVAAAIDEGFDILKNDSDRYSQTLISYDHLEGSDENLKPAANLAASAIKRDDGTVAAYVGWLGSIVKQSSDGGSGTIGMSYIASNLQLADEDAGLSISADAGEDVEQRRLSVAVTNYVDDQKVVHEGKINFAGGDILIGGSSSNTYTGETLVTAGTVTAEKNNAFGNTQSLTISGGSVNLASFAQTVGSLNIASGSFVTGTSTLTLGSGTYEGKTSFVSGTASNFEGTVALQNGHVLTLESAQGLGASGSFQLGSGTALVIDGDQTGIFSKTVSGLGTVQLNASNVKVTADNSDFTGIWSVSSGSQLSAKSSGSLTADAMLGTGVVNLVGQNDGLTITLAGTSETLDNTITGSGALTVVSTASEDSSFGFRQSWGEGSTFKGSMTLSSSGSGLVSFAVGANSSGATNAGNLKDADFTAGSGSLLVVESGGKTETFNDLTFDGGNISFGSSVAINGGDAFGSLTISGAISGSGNVAINIESGHTTDTLANTGVVTAANNKAFLTLIDASGGKIDASEWTLNGTSGTRTIEQSIVQGQNQEIVADAIYNYGLSAGGVNSEDLGLGYEMTEVRIADGKTLQLTESGSLSVVVSDSGTGNLLVTANGLTLNGANTYKGSTTVASGASLTAGASGLGSTSALIVDEGGAYTNAGANTTGKLSISGSVTLNEVLTVGNGGSVAQNATVAGSGGLVLTGGILDVANAQAGSGYSGDISLNSGAGLTLAAQDGKAGLGSGVIRDDDALSTVTVSGAGSTQLTNKIAGGLALDVKLASGSDTFVFASGQSSESFTGTLSLESGTIELFNANNNVLQAATTVVGTNGKLVVNSDTEVDDRVMGALTLNGGVIDFGTLSTTNAEAGQIQVSGGLTIGAPTQIKLSLNELADATGASAFGSGQKLYLIDGYQSISGNVTDDLKWADGNSGSVTQTVTQNSTDVAALKFTNGTFGSDSGGVYAAWGLNEIELLSQGNGGYAIEGSGAITALVTGSGDVTFADGEIEIGGSGANKYTGKTFVTGANVTLKKDEALGDTSNLEISSGSVAFGNTQQTIGAMNVGESGAFSMNGGKVTLSQASTIANDNISVSGTIAVSGTSLTLGSADALGSGAVEMSGDSALVVLSNVGSAADQAIFDNEVTGSGTLQLTNGSSVALTNTANQFTTLRVDANSTGIVSGMQETATALGGAALDVSGRLELSGTLGWTLNNALSLSEKGVLSLNAGGSGNAFNFAGNNQTIAGGTVELADLSLTLGGTSGAANAAVLSGANLVAGSGAHVHVATGDKAQTVSGFALSSGSEITFEGQLGVGSAATTDLGQLAVSGTLTLQAGSTVHVNVDSASGVSSELKQGDLLATAESGSFQKLISAGNISGDASDIKLTDGNGNALGTVTGSILGENGTEVAKGTFGSSLKVSGTSLGVQYGLQAIDIVGDLKISESGALGVVVSSKLGTGSLTVASSGNVTLTGQNTYTVATNVVSGSLTAGEGALGQTKLLEVGSSGSFTNSGANTVGQLNASGTLALNAALTVENEANSGSSIDGTVTGSGPLSILQGSLTVGSGSTSGYSGTVTLGSESGSASLTLAGNANAQLGTGTIEFANANSELKVQVSGNSTLGNLLSGTGHLVVEGTGAESFSFRADQSGGASGFAGQLDLTNVTYDLTQKQNDILGSTALSITYGKLVVNSDTSVDNREIAGLKLEGGTIDFGTIGNGSGVIDLQNHALNTSSTQKTSITLKSELADVNSSGGSAAFMTAEALDLIKNISGGSASVDDFAFTQSGEAFERDILQNNEEVATIKGQFEGLTLSENVLQAKLTASELVLHNQKTLAVSKDGTISLAVTGSGSLAISNQVTLSHAGNSYTGVTSVSDGGSLSLGADNALGHTSELNVSESGSVSFGSYSQTVGVLNASGSLVSAEASGTLTVTGGGSVTGANEGFHLNVDLGGDLTIDNVKSLGTGSITVADEKSLILNAADGQFANAVGGSGGLKVSSGANVQLTGTNDFTGDLVVANAAVSAEGDIYSHIGSGSGAVSLDSGNAVFKLTAAKTSDDWTWSKTVSGSGSLTLANANDGMNLVFGENTLDGLSGSLTLENWNISLASGSNALDELSASQITNLVLTNGADAAVTGETTLDKIITVQSGASLSFNGVGAPGTTSTAAKLTAKELALNDGYVLNLNIADAQIAPQSLLTQDTGSGTSITVAEADDITLHENGSLTINGVEPTSDQTIKFAVEQSGSGSESGHVADAIYGYQIAVNEKTTTEGKDTLTVDYGLEGVSINKDKTLVLSGVDGVSDGQDNTLSVYLTGEGGLRIARNVVRLEAAEQGEKVNDYSGATTVSSSAVLYAEGGTLGNTSALAVESDAVAYIEGDNAVRGLDNSGKLVIGSEFPNAQAGSVVLTLNSDAFAGNKIWGTLAGTGTLRVAGNGQVDEGILPDLTIYGAQQSFYGNLELVSGAWVKLETATNNVFGNNASDNHITLSKESVMTIDSSYNGSEITFEGAFYNGESGGGRVEITLNSADTRLVFAPEQAEAGFNGEFVLKEGTIDLDHLYSDNNVSGHALQNATLALEAGATAKVGTSEAAVDSYVGGLSLEGGTLAFGSIYYDATTGISAHASHVNLGGGQLELASNKGSTITLQQNEVNVISASGSELLAADNGTSIVLLHNIGSLVVDGSTQTSLETISSDLLTFKDNSSDRQVLAQKVNGEDVNVAEVSRRFDANLSLVDSNVEGDEDGAYAVTLGYSIEKLGLLQTTSGVDRSNYKNEALWQGLSISASSNVDWNKFGTSIGNGITRGEKGNIVFRGNEEGNALTLSGDNSYEGKTWLTDNAKIAFGADHAFGATEAVRIDSGSSVDLAGHSQTVGALYALGDGAILGSEKSSLTVESDGVITGANSQYAGKFELQGQTLIDNAASLGTGLVQLNGAGAELTVSGDQASGTMVNMFDGDADTTIRIVSGADVAFVDGAIDRYVGALEVDGKSDLSLVVSDSGFANKVTVAEGGHLAVSADKNTFAFGNTDSKISGALEFGNASFDLSDSGNQAVLDGTELTLNKGAVVSVSTAVGQEDVSSLALNDGSKIVFETGGVPGSVDPSKGHIDLGSGSLSVAGGVTVEVNVGALVNADLVKDAQDKVTNLPLTATDIFGEDQNDEVLANLISGTVSGSTNYTLSLEATGDEYKNETLTVGIRNEASGEEVATGTYGYKLSLVKDGENSGLNLSYGLNSVSVHENKTLRLEGHDGYDNTLGVEVSGLGGLSIAGGTVQLTGKNSYEGATTVAAGAHLETGSAGSSLGNTSMLTLESSGSSVSTALVRGDETVGGLAVGFGSTLTLDAASEGDTTILTIDSAKTDSHSVISGKLVGGLDSVLKVVGDGQSDQPDLLIETANTGFLGSVELVGAHVQLESLNSLGCSGSIGIDATSTLEISSDGSEGVEVGKYNVHKFHNLISGDGMVRISLDDADDYFGFDDEQYKNLSLFTGTFELQKGSFKFTDDDIWGTNLENGNADVFKNVHVVLDGEATLDVSTSNTDTTDRYFKELTLAGGTLSFGSLSIDKENSEAMSAHINLAKGNLTLDDSQRQVEIAFEPGATNLLSTDGSEVVNAADADGSKVVLIHNIGNLTLVDGDAQIKVTTDQTDQSALNNYLTHELADSSTTQVLTQSISGKNTTDDVQNVAKVNRTFGAFGYDDMSAQGMGNALYVGYQINSIELLYTGSAAAEYGDDGRWKGLTVSSSTLSHELSAELTGQGNIVFAKGDGNSALQVGNAADGANSNSYTGRTWVQNGASVEFVADNAFGKTSELRIDDGGKVDLNGFAQTVGQLFVYGENALIGDGNSVLTITGSAQINNANDGFSGSIVFDTTGSTNGYVSDVDGLGHGDVSIGKNYILSITDTSESGGVIKVENNLKDVVAGQGGLLQIGSTLGTAPTDAGTIELSGSNGDFSGTIRVNNGWSLAAAVGSNEDVADRLGSGTLSLMQNGQATVEFSNGQKVDWTHSVTGSGELIVKSEGGTINFNSGFGNDFTGTVTIGAGSMDLAGNADAIGSGNFSASGEEAEIVVGGDQTVEFGKNLTVSNGASLVFEDEVRIGSSGAAPELSVGGALVLNGAQVSVNVEGKLDAGQEPGEALDMSAITMADEGEIKVVIAEASRVEMNNTSLELSGINSGAGTLVDIKNGEDTVATGTYNFGLSVSTDKTELGLSYQLTQVDVKENKTLALSGAVEGETSAVDWANASEFSANVVGKGGLALVNGELKLTGAGNAYEGDTIVGSNASDAESAVLTVGSSLGKTDHVYVNDSGKLVNASGASTTAQAIVATGDVDLQQGSVFTLTGDEKDASVISGSLTGSGALNLTNNSRLTVAADEDYAFAGRVTIGENAGLTLNAQGASNVAVSNSFASETGKQGGTVEFVGDGTTFELEGSAASFEKGTFRLGDGVTLSASDINALGGEGSEILITTADGADATLVFDYDKDKADQYLDFTQTLTQGIAFEKTGSGVLALSDASLGAGSVKVSEGGVLFGASGSDVYDTALTIDGDGAWAAGFGGLASLTVGEDSTFYVGGRAGYNGIEGVRSSDTTTTFTVAGNVHNDGVIVVGNKTEKGETPADEAYIGNELTIEGDYVTDGGVLDLNAVIAGDDDSKADHVTITGGIEGHGYVDVNIDKTASTGGTLKYLGLVSVGEAEDPNNLSLKLKDEVKIGNLWYALVYSADKKEYYLESSATDPGTDPWDPNEREDVGGAAAASLAFMQAQTFDLSLHDHVGETTYVDPITGEVRRTSFWMIQKADWTRFSNDSGQIGTDGQTYTTHMGLDFYSKRLDKVTHRFGVLASFADGDYDMNSGVTGKTTQASFRGYSAGLYWALTPETESGPFAGMQVRWNKFDNELAGETSHDYSVSGLSLTAELGWDQLMSRGVTDSGRHYEWRLEPHVRAYWTNFDDGETWTSGDDKYETKNDNGLLIRLGARTKYAIYNGQKGRTPAVQAYAEANWVFNNGDYVTAVTNPYTTVESVQSGSTFGEFRFGLEGQLSKYVNVWLEGHHQNGSNDFESTGVSVGFKYCW